MAFVSAPLRPYVGDTALGCGTGFFFRPEFGRTFLITNRHMVVQESEYFYPDRLLLKLHIHPTDLKKSDDLAVDLYSDNKSKRSWLELDAAIDVIALEMKAEELKRFVFHAFTPSDLISQDVAVGVGDPLLVIGYPLGFSDEVHNLPVFRQGSVASVYPIPFRGNPFFLIDSELHPGTSGSPVITQPSLLQIVRDEAELFEEPQYRLIGIHSATYADLKLNVVWFAHVIMAICAKAPGSV